MRFGHLVGLTALLALSGTSGCVKGNAGAAILGAALVTAVAVDAVVEAAAEPDVVYVHHYDEHPRGRFYRQCHYDHCHRLHCVDDDCHYHD